MTVTAENAHSQAPVLHAYLLGQVSVQDALYLQRRLLYEVSGENGRQAALVLCEHPLSITVGRSGSRLHILPDDNELRRREIPVVWVNRGGGCWLHLPGQIVAYTAYPVRNRAVGLYRDALRRAVTAALQELGVAPFEILRDGQIRANNRFLGALGIAIHRGYATYGFCLNVSLQTHHFQMLQLEPGIPLRATTVEALRSTRTRMSRVRECLIRRYCESLGVQNYSVCAGDTLLQTRLESHAKVASRRT